MPVIVTQHDYEPYGLGSVLRGSSQSSLPRALSLVAGVWLTLALTGWLGSFLPRSAVLLVGFSAATVLVLAARRRRRRELLRARSLPPLLVGASTGFAAITAVTFFAGWVGGNPPAALSDSSEAMAMAVAAPWASAVTLVVLAPVFEEILYREQLLDALRAEVGSWAGVVGSAFLYAVTHGSAVSVAGAFAFGLILACIVIRTESVLLCVAIHSGANAAWLGAHALGSSLGASPWMAGLLALASAAGIAMSVRLQTPPQPVGVGS